MKTPVRMISTSETQTFKRCRQKWYWACVMNLRPKSSNKPALIFGDIWHQSLAMFYKPGRRRGPKPWKTFETLYMNFVDEHGKMSIKDLDQDDERIDLGLMGIDLARMYYDHYGDDEDIEVISPEFPFYVRLKDSQGKPFYVVGRMDAGIIWVPTGETGIFEHKTGSEEKKRSLILDEQGGMYWTFGTKFLKKMGIIDRLSEVDMVLYNFAAKRKKDERPQNKEGLYLNMNGSVSKRQPKDPFERIPVYRGADDRKVITERVVSEATEMRLAEEGKLDIYKNPTDNCHWDCQFFSMCELHESGSDYRGFMNSEYTVVNHNERYDDVLKMIRKEVRSGKLKAS